MKRKLLVLVAIAAVIGWAGTAAWALPTINIYDLAETGSVVTTSGFTDLSPTFSDTNPIIDVTQPEFLLITGFITENFQSPAPKTWGVRMLEADGSVSDFATMYFDTAHTAQGLQAITLNFVSDGADNFQGLLQAFNAQVDAEIITLFKPDFLEDATLQNLFSFSGLAVNAASDVEVIPLPGTVLLLGSGLLGLVGIRKFRKS